jgi:hypothetical protein
MQRDLVTLWSLKVNNFFFFVLFLIYGALQSGLPPWSAYPFLALLGLLLLLPASSDPLERIPAERLALWPLGRVQRVLLRVFSLALSPVLWFSALEPILLVPLGLQCFVRIPQGKAIVRVPLLPGRLGGLITNNLREMLSVFDTWMAILLAALAMGYRVLFPHPDPESLPILGMLVALALSTYAQSLFGLDLESAITRYRLLPLPGWQILLAKDAAFLGILLILTLLLEPLPALTFGLTSLTIGHHSSLRLKLSQKRWRFTAGRLLPVGALQAIASLMLGFMELRAGLIVLFGVTVIWGFSVWWYGEVNFLATPTFGPHRASL